MKQSVLSITAGLLAVGMVAGVPRQAEAVEATLDVPVNTAYVWRGITFNDGFVLQPSVDVASESGLGINVWGNFDIDDYDGAVEDGEFSEIDLTVTYAVPVDGFDLTIGFIEYLFPGVAATGTDATGAEVVTGAAEGTREVFVDASVGVVDNVSVGATVYYDIDEVEDYYASFYTGIGLPVIEDVDLELGVSVGVGGEDATAGADSGLHDINVSLSGSTALTETVSVGGFVQYVDSLDSDALPDEAVDVDVFGGVNISVAL